MIGPELGLTLPGLTIVCGDSHTSTHGAFGALAFGIGTSEVEHVLVTQTLAQRKPKTFKVEFTGRLGPHVSSKDMVLKLIGTIGTAGGAGHVLEYCGETIRALSMEARMTHLQHEHRRRRRAGLIAPDETTFDYIAGGDRPLRAQGRGPGPGPGPLAHPAQRPGRAVRPAARPSTASRSHPRSPGAPTPAW